MKQTPDQVKATKLLDSIPEATEIERGEKLVVLLGLKPVGRNHNDYGMSPPRYQTAWGTKTALGLFRSIGATIHGLD